MSNQPTPERPKSFVLVQFAETGSVQFAVEIDGVTPLQMIALAAFLELRGKNELIRLENQRVEEEAQKAIARPKLVMPGSMQ